MKQNSITHDERTRKIVLEAYRKATAIIGPLQEKMCFANAQMMAFVSNGELEYWEGLLISPSPGGERGYKHAWNRHKDTLIDLTPSLVLSPDGEELCPDGVIPAGFEFFGCQVSYSEVVEHVRDSKSITKIRDENFYFELRQELFMSGNHPAQSAELSSSQI